MSSYMTMIFSKGLALSHRDYPERKEWSDSHTRLEEEMIEQLKPSGEGARKQSPGWIIRRAQRKFENKLY